MSDIRLLPTELCNQIAAGEVVERPASVVKELVENSLDAGATQIDVCLENGGQSLIRVQDNGLGIAREQLELAVTRHATSKIGSLDDLDRISSYGFRGEALPSIASVSRFRLLSRRKNLDSPEESAAFLEVEHGVISRKGSANLPTGTLIEVRDLFASTPARLKFLKSPATELKRAQNWLCRLSLASLGTGFSFSAADREILRFLPNEELRYRLGKIWSHDLAEELLPISASVHGISLEGLAGPPQLRQAKPDRILFYVNGRPVNDKRLMSAVKEAYRGRIISRDYPQLVLFVNINPMEIDVNVHPAKTEVRFRNEGALFSAVSAAMGQAFQNLSQLDIYAVPENFPIVSQRAENSINNPAQNFWASLPDPPIVPQKEKSREKGEWETVFNQKLPENNVRLLQEGPAPFSSGPLKSPSAQEESFAAIPEEKARYKENCLQYLGQIAATYLALKDATGALLLLDQHAAHERVLFHRIMKGNLESGVNLIVAIELSADAEKRNLLKRLSPALEAFGFKFHFEGNKVLIKRIPALLTRVEARDFIGEVLAERKENLEGLYISLACRGAIKAGQKLSSDEAYELLRQWRETPQAEFCPHGRPCVLRWDAASLEKLFKRR